MLDARHVTRRLLIGAGRGLTDEDCRRVVAMGVTDVVDLSESPDDAAVLAAEERLSVLWNPAPPDLQPKDAGWFARSLSWALPPLTTPRRLVAIRCDNGRDRAPSTAFAVLLALGWEDGAALDLIRAARPDASLAYAGDAYAAVRQLGYF